MNSKGHVENIQSSIVAAQQVQCYSVALEISSEQEVSEESQAEQDTASTAEEKKLEAQQVLMNSELSSPLATLLTVNLISDSSAFSTKAFLSIYSSSCIKRRLLNTYSHR